MKTDELQSDMKCLHLALMMAGTTGREVKATRLQIHIECTITGTDVLQLHKENHSLKRQANKVATSS